MTVPVWQVIVLSWAGPVLSKLTAQISEHYSYPIAFSPVLPKKSDRSFTRFTNTTEVQKDHLLHAWPFSLAS